MHWSAQYIGLPYVEGTNDCASFAVKVQREVFNRTIELPQDRAANIRGVSKQITNNKNDCATPTTKPQDGDAVLMVGRGRINHIGIYVEFCSVPYVLHAMQGAKQVCLHRIRELNNFNLSLEGFYKWKTI